MTTQSLKRLPIAEATAAQIRDFAQNSQGIANVTPSDNKATLCAKLSPVWPEDYILVPDEGDAPLQAQESAGSGQPPPSSGEMVPVLIPANEEKGGEEPVPVKVNGRVMLIPRGKQVLVPRPYAMALKTAVQIVYPQEGPHNQMGEPREVQRLSATIGL